MKGFEKIGRGDGVLSRGFLAPVVAAVGLVSVAIVFAVELGAFRHAVIGWARRDLAARAQLAARSLAEPLATQDFRQIQAFGDDCRRRGMRLTVYSGAGAGIVYDSDAHGTDEPDVSETVPCGEGRLRLGLGDARTLAPFRRALVGFALAFLVGVAGMLFVFFALYRQRVKIRELTRLEEFRRAFIADFSHELRTPLTGILGAADLMPPDDPLARLVRRESKRLNALAQGVLDLARLERGDDLLERAPTDLLELAHETAARLEREASARSCAIRVSGRRTTAVCDAVRVGQALDNLVANAIRHSGADEVTVTVDGDRRTARITVADRGVGIPSEHIARIFERFHRVDPARAAATGGAGLGLAIVRRIARLHGGDVTYAPNSPRGSLFTFTLPV